jgi:hypothetical protein
MAFNSLVKGSMDGQISACNQRSEHPLGQSDPSENKAYIGYSLE